MRTRRTNFQPNPGSQELGPHQVRCEERTWRRRGAVSQQFQYTPGHHVYNQNDLPYLTISYNILQSFSLRVNYRRGNVSHCHCQHVSLGQVGSHGRCHPSQRSQGSYERRVLGPTRTGLVNFLWMSLVKFGKVSIGF